MQLGPLTRTPQSRAMAPTRSCSASPSGPASAKPEVMMRAPPTPRDPHSSITLGTRSAGTAITARSTGSGRSAIDG